MALLVELCDLKAVVKRLEHDLDISNDNLLCVKDKNERLSKLIEVLKTEVHVAQTVGSIQKKDNVFGVTPGQVDMVEGGKTEEFILEYMDADMGADINIYEIHEMCYKLKWHNPYYKSRSIWICCESDAHMIVEAGRSTHL